MTDNKRIHQRFTIQRGVKIKLLSGTIIYGVTRDLSFGGSFIECDSAEFSSGDECYLSVVLENDEESSEIFSNIRYANKDGIGCHFLTFNTGYYQFLTNYSVKVTSSIGT